MASFTRESNRVGGVGGTIIDATDINAIYTTLEGRGINVKDPLFGAVGDGVTDDTAAINAAMAAANAAGGGIVYLPPGTYLLSTITQQGDPNKNYFLRVRANVTIAGSGWGSVLKIANGILSVDTVANNAHVIAGFTGDDDVLIRDLTIDMNGANNLTPSGRTRNAMAIRSEYGNRWHVDNVYIKNCPGHNMIVFGDGGSDGWITNCKLLNGGRNVGGGITNTYNPDFSFIYSEWDGSHFIDNEIEQDNIDIALALYSGGIEMHGSRQYASGNTIIGCDPGIYVVSNIADSYNEQRGVHIHHNTFRDVIRGVELWMSTYPMRGVTIDHNHMLLNKGSTTASSRACFGIEQPNATGVTFNAANANGRAVEDLVIDSNVIESKLAIGSTHTTRGMQFHGINRGSIEKNRIRLMTDIGIALVPGPWGLTDLDIDDNWIMDCGHGTGATSAGMALEFSATTPTTPDQARMWRGVSIDRNHFGNTHDENYTGAGTLINSECKGYMKTGIQFIGLGSGDKVERLTVGDGNEFFNILNRFDGLSSNINPEGDNGEVRWRRPMVHSTVKPMTETRFFGGEYVLYRSNDTIEKCTTQGYATTKTGTASGASGQAVVTVNSATLLRVGMQLEIAGAGAAAGTLYARIKSIAGVLITLESNVLTTVTNAAYIVTPPAMSAVTL